MWREKKPRHLYCYDIHIYGTLLTEKNAKTEGPVVYLSEPEESLSEELLSTCADCLPGWAWGADLAVATLPLAGAALAAVTVVVIPALFLPLPKDIGCDGGAEPGGFAADSEDGAEAGAGPLLVSLPLLRGKGASAFFLGVDPCQCEAGVELTAGEVELTATEDDDEDAEDFTVEVAPLTTGEAPF